MERNLRRQAGTLQALPAVAAGAAGAAAASSGTLQAAVQQQLEEAPSPGRLTVDAEYIFSVEGCCTLRVHSRLDGGWVAAVRGRPQPLATDGWLLLLVSNASAWVAGCCCLLPTNTHPSARAGSDAQRAAALAAALVALRRREQGLNAAVQAACEHLPGVLDSKRECRTDLVPLP